MCCFYEAKTIKVDLAKIPKEPQETVNVAAIRAEYAGKTCPVCNGLGMLRCKDCQNGQVEFLGGYQQCTNCSGTGVKVCFVCNRHGQINGKLDKAAGSASRGHKDSVGVLP